MRKLETLNTLIPLQVPRSHSWSSRLWCQYLRAGESFWIFVHRPVVLPADGLQGRDQGRAAQRAADIPERDDGAPALLLGQQDAA